MKSTVLLPVLIFLTFNSVSANSCGGLLEGEQGRLSIADESNQEDQPVISSLSCLWIIQMHYENNVRFTLNALDKDAVLNLYPEDQLTSCCASSYKQLNSSQVGSSFEFLGKTLIVILPNSSASVVFSWHFIGNEYKNSSVATMKNSDYIDSSNGLLEWEQLRSAERVTWVINTNAKIHIIWDVVVATSCDANDNCACFYFAILQLTSAGALSEAVKTCGQSSEGKLEVARGRVVILVKVNTRVAANKVAVSWVTDNVIVTEPPVTEPPVPTATGLFAATTTGLVALNLQTLEATSLTSGYAVAVAVNQNLKKVYWSETANNCRILRANFDGSDEEIIVPPTGNRGYIFALAVHELSGNVYFNVHYSNKISVCDALGGNCGVVISSSSLASYPYSIALDYDNNVMYWSNYKSGTSLIRANLDGSSVTTISSGFSTSVIVVISLVQPSNNALYWADYGENTIGTIYVNGSNKRTLAELESNPGPDGIQVDANKIYFGNWGRQTIQSVDRDSGTELTTIFNSTGRVRHLALFSAPA